MKLAVVGCGAAAEHLHLPALASMLGRDAVWLVDPHRERALGLARRYGGEHRVATDHRELVGAVDAAIVAVPNHLHAPVAVDFLSAGVHVLCEKPLARTAAEARQVLDAVGPGTVLAIGNLRRFFPSTQLVRDLVGRGFCGRPLELEAEEGAVYAWQTRSGFSIDRERAGGGVLADIGSHVLDQLRLWLGPGLEIVGYRDDAHGGLEADCVVELAVGGAHGRVELSRTRDLGTLARIVCEDGTIEAPLGVSGPVTVESGGRRHVLDAGATAGGGYTAAAESQLSDFLAAIETGRPPEATGADGLAVVELIEACYARREPLDEPWVTETLAVPAR
jgi:predicted dehydrogenase